MVDSMTPEQRSRCMSRIRSKDTKPELALRRKLFSSGLRFRTRLKMTGRPDIVFTRAHIAVFVDGCFWHGCPAHGTLPKSNADYWSVKIRRNAARDAAVNSVLEAEGWTVLRFWDHEIKEDLEKVASDIEAAWRSATFR